MKKTVKALRVIVLAALFALVPISVMAGSDHHGGGHHGGGHHGGGQSVPEPTTLLLLAAGGGIMMVKKFRKK